MRLLLLLIGIVAIAPVSTLGRAQTRPGRNPHGAISIPCENCHTATSWKPIRGVPEFDHNRTSYPLRGMHAKVDCTQCHTSLVFNKASTRCSDCHADLHRGQFGADCAQCHTVRGWEVQAQQIRQHDNRFPLLGAHAALQCSDCHTGGAVGQFAGLSTQCLSCHTADFQKATNPDHKASGFSTSCETCHTADTWANARFDHLQFTGYALTGMHATVACDLCHVNGQYKNTPTLCYSCHAKDFQSTTDPNHVAASFPTTCDQCHTTAGWSPALFDHNKTSFALTGAHTTVACNTCHTDNFAGTLPTNCYGCHTQDFNSTATIAGAPNHVTANFPQDCTLCHTTATWLNSTFNHSTTAFPLTGAHTTVVCATCHTDNYKGTLPTNCYGCHTPDYNSTANIAGVPNHVTAGFAQDCTQCHTTATWLNATFNHNATVFPLSGAHTTVACTTCHTDNFKGTLPTNCYGCHTPDYNSTANIAGVPNHVTANFPQDCTMCHTTTTWLNATFNHNATSFPLTGAHTTVACATCHTENFAGTLPTNCYGCHVNDYNSTANITGVPNHANASFSQDCTQCHTTTTWLNATFNHNTTSFPLTGAHTTVACTTCHTDNFKGTLPTNCYGCHTQDFNSTASIAGVPNHVTANFPQDCTLCHTTTTWLNSTFNHSTTSFPLTGAHTTVACATCHTDNYKGTLPTNCYGCHVNDYNSTANIAGVPNHINAGFAQDCTQCHTTTTWLNATFNHNSTSFPLTGAHTTVACATCHTDNYKGTLPTNCYGCHTPDYNSTANIAGVPNHVTANFPQDCTVCHSTSTWLNATFNHSTTIFPLTGAHTTVACNTCHTDNYKGTLPTTCYGCHTPDYNSTTNLAGVPNHVSLGYPQDCTICHTTATWLNATFNHSTTPFPLTGAHVNVACNLCHIGGVFAGTPTDCYSCHKADYTGTTNPVHSAAGFPTTCATCHTTTSWLGATFNHTWFPMNHGNANSVCATCHTNPNDYSVFQCTNCHTAQQTNPQHNGINGYVYNSVNCYSCHKNGGG